MLDDFRDIVKRDEPLAAHTFFRLGGPAEYFGPGLRTIHSRLASDGLNDEVFDVFVGLFEDVLKELAVPDDQRGQVMALPDGDSSTSARSSREAPFSSQRESALKPTRVSFARSRSKDRLSGANRIALAAGSSDLG